MSITSIGNNILLNLYENSFQNTDTQSLDAESQSDTATEESGASSFSNLIDEYVVSEAGAVNASTGTYTLEQVRSSASNTAVADNSSSDNSATISAIEEATSGESVQTESTGNVAGQAEVKTEGSTTSTTGEATTTDDSDDTESEIEDLEEEKRQIEQQLKNEENEKEIQQLKQQLSEINAELNLEKNAE